MKIALSVIGVVVAALIIVVVGAKVWGSIQAHDKAWADAHRQVAESSIASQQLMAYDLGESNITFEELFNRIDSRLKDIDDDAVSISASDLSEQQRNGISDYLHKVQDILRLEEDKYRKLLAVSNSIDSAKRAVENYKITPYNEYSDAWERRQAQDSVDEASKAQRDSAMASRQYADSLSRLKKYLTPVPNFLHSFKLIDINQLENFIKKAS